MSELKPCPFCGGEAERYTVLPQPGFENRQVQCRSCGATAFDLKWQTRTPEPAPQDNAEIVERCARIAADAAEGSRILHNAAAKDHDRDGCNIHAEGWRTGLQIAAAIRALISTPNMPKGDRA